MYVSTLPTPGRWINVVSREYAAIGIHMRGAPP
jgi:hypothetical protein